MSRFNYAYILDSIRYLDRRYTGMTSRLDRRLQARICGQVRSTHAARPWQIQTALVFRSAAKAAAFERYLKSDSGRVFAAQHF